MNDTDTLELNELCSALVDGALTDAQRARLEEMLRGSEDARRFYVRQMGQSASLHSYAAEMLSEAAEPVNVVRPALWQRPAAWLAAAASVAAGLLIWSVFFTSENDDEADLPDMVARLTGGKDCEWGGAALSMGDEIAAGQRVELVRGFAELTFDSGAQVTLEGPALLEVRSAWEADLARGTLKANVPEEASGFRVTNPAVEVVDIGTEFSMTAMDGEAEVFVLRGSVEAHTRDSTGNRKAKTVLSEKQAKRFAGANSHEVPDREVKFQKHLKKVTIEPLRRPLAYSQWSFDEGSGAVATATGSADGRRSLVFENAPEWTNGRFGTAVVFDGVNSAKVELSGSLRKGAKTVAFWARIPAATPLTNAGTMLSVPAAKAWHGPLCLAWNRLPGEGVIGALRLQAVPGSLVGSSNLRDGRWHHVAAVFPSSFKAGTKPRLKIYVDGRLENATASKPSRGLDKTDAEGLLMIGRSPSGDHFVGELDEVVLADQQLSPQQIRHLMHSNLVLSFDALARL